MINLKKWTHDRNLIRPLTRHWPRQLHNSANSLGPVYNKISRHQYIELAFKVLTQKTEGKISLKVKMKPMSVNNAIADFSYVKANVLSIMFSDLYIALELTELALAIEFP